MAGQSDNATIATGFTCLGTTSIGAFNIENRSIFRRLTGLAQSLRQSSKAHGTGFDYPCLAGSANDHASVRPEQSEIGCRNQPHAFTIARFAGSCRAARNNANGFVCGATVFAGHHNQHLRPARSCGASGSDARRARQTPYQADCDSRRANRHRACTGPFAAEVSGGFSDLAALGAGAGARGPRTAIQCPWHRCSGRCAAARFRHD